MHPVIPLLVPKIDPSMQAIDYSDLFAANNNLDEYTIKTLWK